MTFGSDFQYENALSNFKNMDKLIKYVNQQVRFFFICFFFRVKNIFIFPYKSSKLMVVTSTSFTQHHHVICMLWTKLIVHGHRKLMIFSHMQIILMHFGQAILHQELLSNVMNVIRIIFYKWPTNSVHFLTYKHEILFSI